MASFATGFSRFFSTSKQSPSIQKILDATPYTSALWRPQVRVAGSFSMAKTCLKRPERAKAIALPPAPAKASMMIDFEEGPPVLMCSAMRLSLTLDRWYEIVGREEVLGYGFGGHAEPHVVGHPDAFVVTGPDVVALMPVPVCLSACAF